MRYILLISTLCISQFIISQNSKNPLLTSDKEAQAKWVDSVYSSLSLKEKVGQLFMARAFSNQGQKHINQISTLINEHKIGGLIYSTGGPVRQARLNNQFQAVSKTPLLIGMDAEWGLSMRLDSTHAFPWNMTLGAIKNNLLIEQTGRYLGEHCKRIGVHFNFAPVVDINTNPKNPIIGNRSFGEDRDNVTEKSLAFMKGMQSVGVLANAKHFPGHGDTDSDSHKTLPTISFNEKRIDSIELYPYKKLINAGLSSVMVAHLNVPALEKRAGFPSSLSKHIVTDILKDSLGFKGLIYSDALEMKGVADYMTPTVDGNNVNSMDTSGDVDLAAFLAGNDVLLISENVPAGINKITKAYESGVISEERLAHSVKKILQAKYKVDLHKFKPIGITNLHKDLNRIKDKILNEELFENAITIAKNDKNVLPIQHLETKSIAYVKLGDDDGSTFLNELKKYSKVHEIQADKLDDLLTKLKNYNTVIVGFHRSNANPWKSHKFSDKELVWLYEIARNNNVVLDVFVKPYALLDLKTIENIESIIVSYQNSEIAQQKSAQLIFGAFAAKGILPVSLGNGLNVGNGVSYNSLSRLGYSSPERVGMSSEKLNRLDSIAQYSVDSKITPGIQLLVARKGKVIYTKVLVNIPTKEMRM